MNDYDEIAKSVFAPAPGSSTTPPSGDADYSAIQQGVQAQRTQALEQSGAVASQTTPDNAAKIQALADKAKLPYDIVERHYEQIASTQRESLDYEDIIRKTPKTADWLTNPNNSRVASDDVANLQAMETHIAKHSSALTLYDNLNSGIYSLAKTAAEVPAFAWDLSATAQNVVVDNLGLPQYRARFAPDALRKNVVTDFFDEQANIWKQPELDKSVYDEASKGNFREAGWVLANQIVANAPTQAALIAGTIAGYGVPALVGAGVVAGAGANAEAQEKVKSGEVSPEVATAGAAAKGVIESAFERLGTTGILQRTMSQLEKTIGKEQAKVVMFEGMKHLAYGAAPEGLEEGATSGAQDIVDYVSGVNPNALQGMGQRMFDATAVGAGSGLTMTGPAAIGASLQKAGEVRRTQMAKDFYLSMGQSAEAQKIRERLPEAQKSFVEGLVKDTAVENIFVPTEALDVLFQDENPIKAMQDMGIAQAYEQAKEAGTDVKIPLATWVSNVVGTPAFEGLADDVKFSPDSKSVNEVKAEREETARVLEQEAAKSQSQKIDLSDKRLSAPGFWSNEDAIRSVVKTREQADHLESQALDANIAANEAVKAGDTSTQQQIVLADTKKALAALSKIKEALPISPATIEDQASDIGNYIAEQLKAAGQDDQAAVIHEGFFKALSQRYQDAGVDLSPQQLFDQYRLSVQGPNTTNVVQPGANTTNGVTLNQKSRGDWKLEGFTLSDVKQDEDRVAVYMDSPDGGTAGIAEFDVVDGQLYPSSVNVVEQYQRKGIASAMYSKVEKVTGMKVIPSDQQTKDAREFWDQDNRPFGRNLFQSATAPAKPFYSKLQQVIDQKIQGSSATVQQVQGVIRDIKPEERKWSGIDEFLKGKEKVSKAELQEFLAANELQIQEVTKDQQPETLKAGRANRRAATDKFIKAIMADGASEAEANGIAEDIFENLYSFNVESLPESIRPAASEFITAQQKSSDPTKFEKYTLPGGENYREVLFTLPPKPTTDLPEGFSWREVPEAGPTVGRWWLIDTDGRTAGFGNTKEAALADYDKVQAGAKEDGAYRSGHWDEANVLAHVRLNDRTDADGKKVLFVEEIQSDWHQAGRKQGYKEGAVTPPEVRVVKNEGRGGWTVESDLTKPGTNTTANIMKWEDTGWGERNQDFPGGGRGYRAAYQNQAENFESFEAAEWWAKDKVSGVNKLLAEQTDSRVPDAPFRKTWHEFALKRIIRMAAEGGYDRVAWTTGEQQAERYDLSKQISRIEMVKDYAGRETLLAYDIGGEQVMAYAANDNRDLSEFIGKEAAQKLGEKKYGKANADGLSKKVLKGLDLKVGGEGMKGFYDKILVDFANKFGKKYGAKVGETSLNTANGLTAKYEYSGIETGADVDNALTEYRNEWNVDTVRQGEAVLRAMDDGDATFNEAMQQHGSPMLAEALGAKYKDVSGNDATKAHALDVTPELRNAALNEGFTLFQDGPQDPRGQIALMPNEAIIRLGQAADPSTFFHETGHYFFEFLTRLNANESTPQTVKDDYQKLLKWLEVPEGQAPNTAQLEQFARGFEAYIMEGKAPSSGLKKAFATFKVWLTSVYRQLKGLDVELNDEVRGVMDRLLATEEEIAAARLNSAQSPFIPDAVAAGMSKDLAFKYQKATLASRQFAEEEMTAALMRDLTRKQQGEYREKRKEVRAEMEKVVAARPNQRALSILQSGKLPDGSELPSDTPAIKLDPKSVQAVLEANGTADLKLPRGVTNAKSGFPVGVVAEGMGYQSEGQFLRDLAVTKPYAVAVEEATEQMMRGLYPELLGAPQATEEAIKAIHNEGRSEMLQLELQYLIEKAPALFKDAIRRTVRRPPTIKAVRAQAEAMIGKQITRDIRPSMYQRAEVKAAKQAGEALAKGDIQGAFDAKNRELLNHELYRAAVTAKTELAAAKPMFKRYFRKNDDLAKSRDMDLINAGRAILAEFGVGKTDKSAQDYLQPIANYDNETYQTMLALVDSATEGAGPVEEVTYDDFSAMKLALEAIWDLSKNIKTIEIDGKKVSQETAIAAMQANISERLKGPFKEGYTRSASERDIWTRWLQSARAAFTRVESWTVLMDNGEQGAFHDYMLNPVFEGVTQYRLEKAKYLKKYLDLVKPLQGKLSGEEIFAAELGAKGFTFDNKAQLLGMLLHTGNNSNKSKLLRGYGWATVNEDGSLDTTKFDAFIARMQRDGVLTKADYDFVQSVWNLFEEMKPMAQKAHKSMYGFYFNEVTADEFTTPFGTYRGGYAPAKVDTFLSEDAALRSEKEQLERSNNSYAFPTAGRGATKTRVEAYAAPLQMDLGLVGSHIDWALRFAHIEPHVKSVSKMLWNKGFQQALSALDPTVRSNMLIPWLQRAAQQSVETPSTTSFGRGLDAFCRTIRNRSSLNIMALNVVNTIEQYTGLSIAATKVKPALLRDALWGYVRDRKNVAESVTSKSDYMKTKVGESAREVQHTIDRLLLEPTKYEKAREFAEAHGYFMQQSTQGVVDIVVWSAAYNQALENKLSEKEAVREADSIVRQTQGSGAPESVSRAETGTPFVRLFMSFYGYFNMQTNLLGVEGTFAREMGLRKGGGRGLYLYAMGFMIPAILGAALRKLAAGGIDEDDDEEYLDDYMEIFFLGQARALFALMPGSTGQFAQRMLGLNKEYHDDKVSLSPAISAIEAVTSTPSSVYKAIAEEGSKKKAVKDVLNSIGTLTGYPTGAFGRPAGYLIDVQEGNAEPSGVVDFTRGLVTGRSGTPR